MFFNHDDGIIAIRSSQTSSLFVALSCYGHGDFMDHPRRQPLPAHLAQSPRRIFAQVHWLHRCHSCVNYDIYETAAANVHAQCFGPRLRDIKSARNTSAELPALPCHPHSTSISSFTPILLCFVAGTDPKRQTAAECHKFVTRLG